MANKNVPIWATDDFWPRPSDTIEELEKKQSLNTKTAFGEICLDFICPDRIGSDTTEFQSNALVAGQYISDKKKNKK